MSIHDHRHADAVWQTSVEQWYRQDYLIAMEGFQQALRPYQRAWNDYSTTSGNSDTSEDRPPVWDAADHHDIERAIMVARRLLFCSYCELDGNQTESARQRLVQCLSILYGLQHHRQHLPKYPIVLDDAWMELMLSLEEVPEHRLLARHVAKMAIAMYPGR